MNANHMCDKELLVGYLYDEIDPASRRACETHLASCAECRGELADLRATREQIAIWTPPEHELGFQIVRRPPAARAPWLRLSPAWGLAAAAVLVLAAASAIANVEVRYGSDGLTVRTGWADAPAPVAAPARPDATAALDLVNQRLDQLEAARAEAASVVPAAATPRVAEVDLQRVRQLIADSETRQNRELALRIRQLTTEVSAQRRVDVAAFQQSLQSATGTEAVMHRELMNYVNGLYRVSQAK